MLIACSPLIGERMLGGADRGAIVLSGMAASALAANTVLSRYPRLFRPETIILVQHRRPRDRSAPRCG